MTYEEVLAKHDVAHVTLGPKATPEALDRELAKIGAASAAWAAFRPEEIEAAKVARLHDLLGEISKLAGQGDTDRILELTDIPVDVDLEVDTAWMRAEREKRGEPLPAAA